MISEVRAGQPEAGPLKDGEETPGNDSRTIRPTWVGLDEDGLRLIDWLQMVDGLAALGRLDQLQARRLGWGGGAAAATTTGAATAVNGRRQRVDRPGSGRRRRRRCRRQLGGQGFRGLLV